MSVVLLSPPVVKACEPLLGIATLKAYLEAHGVPCACIDVNAEVQEWLLDPEHLDCAIAKLQQAPGALAPRVRRVAGAWPGLRKKLARTKALLRSPAGYVDFALHRSATTTLNRAMGLAAAAHALDEGSPVTVSLTDYLDARFCDMASASVRQAYLRPEANLFYPYFRQVLVPRLRALRPTVAGISLIFRNQLLSGMALAGLLRKELPGVHVTLGGDLISAWAPFLERTHLVDVADSILPYEGERGLLALARALGPGGDGLLEAVPNLCWRAPDGRCRKNGTAKLASLSEAPAPDYSFAPWHLYFAPARVAPMVAARGCYWNRCSFCPEVANPEAALRLAEVDRLLSDLETVHTRDGASLFHFIDSALPPRAMRAIARHVIAQERPWRWYGFSRLEPHFFREGVARELAAGGCRMLKLGIETASQRLLDTLGKRQDLRDVSRVLRALREARILVHGYLMFGTPREELADAEATRLFVAEHADCIQFLNCALMNLARGSPMRDAPHAHGIRALHPFEVEGHDLDLALYDNFDGEGWGRRGARRYLNDVFLTDARVRPLHLQTPAFFDANHSPFFHQALFGEEPPATKC